MECTYLNRSEINCKSTGFHSWLSIAPYSGFHNLGNNPFRVKSSHFTSVRICVFCENYPMTFIMKFCFLYRRTLGILLHRKCSKILREGIWIFEVAWWCTHSNTILHPITVINKHDMFNPKFNPIISTGKFMCIQFTYTRAVQPSLHAASGTLYSLFLLQYSQVYMSLYSHC